MEAILNPTDLESLINSPWFWAMIVWSLAWKGVALWKSAQNKDLVWYLVMLLFNTVGLIEIVYIFIFARDKQEK